MPSMATQWCLQGEERQGVVERLSNNIGLLAFFSGQPVGDSLAREAAEAIEKKAYTTAEVSARTTTGDRPWAETTYSYARKLGELALEFVKLGGFQQEVATSQGQEVDLTGSRDFLTADAAAALLQPLLENSAVITKEDEALEVLRIICKALTGTKLQRLNLSDNALGEKGIRACADALTSQGGLESLALQNIGCSIHACKAVGELLASAALRQLHLYNNMSDNEGAQHIAAVLARSPAMEDFRMASSRVGPEGGIALAEALGAGSSLVKLDLSDNPMTEEVAPALGRCLALQPQLRILNLNDTGLCDTGISELMSALAAASSQLRELELALNEITPKGASAVARYLVTAQGLERLNLRENEMGDRGVVVVARALQASTTLRALDLCQNQVRRVGAVAAAQATANKPAFELLALDENEISEEGIEQLEAAMTKVFGHTKFLGPLDENDPDADEEEEGDDDEEEEELTAAMGASSLS